MGIGAGTALLVGGLGSAAAGIYGAKKSSSAIESAADSGTALQQQALAWSQNALSPYTNAYGMNALIGRPADITPPDRDETFQRMRDEWAGLGQGEYVDWSKYGIGTIAGPWAYGGVRSDTEIRNAWESAGWVQAAQDYETKQLQDAAGFTGGLLSDPSSFQSSPGFEFLRDKSMNQLTNALSGSGLLRSGNRIDAASNLITGLTLQDYNNRVQQYLNLAQLEQAGAAGGVSSTLSGTNSIADSMLNAAQASAAGTLGMTNSIGNALNWGANQYMDYNMLNQQRNALAYNNPYSPYYTGTSGVSGNALAPSNNYNTALQLF